MSKRIVNFLINWDNVCKNVGYFVQCIFTVLLQLLTENNFLLTVNTDKPNFVASLVF